MAQDKTGSSLSGYMSNPKFSAGMDSPDAATSTGPKPKSSPTPEQVWGINGHEDTNFNNHRVNASSNATHAGILASQAPMKAPLASPNMLSAPGSLNFVRPQ